MVCGMKDHGDTGDEDMVAVGQLQPTLLAREWKEWVASSAKERVQRLESLSGEK